MGRHEAARVTARRTPAPKGRAESRFAGAAPRWYGVGLAVGIVATLVASNVITALNDPTALEPGNLVIISGRDDGLNGQRLELVKEWNKLHKDNKADLVELPSIADAQRAEMLARAQSDEQQVDVYNLDVTWTAEFADAGYLRRIDEDQVSTDGFLPAPLSTCRYRGRLWALPFNTDVGLLYYRKDILPGLDPPTPPVDWNTLFRQASEARAQAKAQGKPPLAGYLSQLGDYEGLTVSALEAAWGSAGTVVDDSGSVLPDDRDVDAVQNGLNLLRDLSPSGLPASVEADSTDSFRKGEAMFMRNWPVARTTLAQGPSMPFDVAPLPGGAALGGQNLAVAAKSAHPRAARALIEFLTNERSEQRLFELGGLPATRDVVYRDARYESDTFVQTLLQALDDARHRPTVPHYAEFSAEFRRIVDENVRSPVPSRLVAEKVRDRLDDALLGRAPAEGD